MGEQLEKLVNDYVNLKSEVSGPQYSKIINEFLVKMSIASISQINEQVLFSYKKSIRTYTDIKGIVKESRNSSINKKLVVTISFVRYLQRLKLLETNIEMPSLNSKDSPRRELLTLSQCKALLSVQNKDYLGTRDNIILQIFLLCALRISELLDIRWNSFSKYYNNHILTIKGKGNKERKIKVTSELFMQLSQFKKKWFHDVDLSSHVFLSIPKLRNGFKPKKLSKSSVRFLIKKYCKKAGIENHVHPHMLRHQSLSLSLIGNGESGASPRAIQLQAGWSSLSMANTYIHSVKDINCDAVDHNPLAKSKTQVFD